MMQLLDRLSVLLAGMGWVDWLGWVATAMFIVSYFASPRVLRGIQASSAVLWVIYGFAQGTAPVWFTNIMVCVIAVVTMFRKPAAPAAARPEAELASA